MVAETHTNRNTCMEGIIRASACSLPRICTLSCSLLKGEAPMKRHARGVQRT
jgi:hypothetical protein